MRKILVNNIASNPDSDVRKMIICKSETKNTKKDMEQFVCSVIHNLRSPLNSILGVTDIMLNDGLEQDEMEMLIKEINNSIMRMDNTIGELLDYAKTVHSENERVEVDINEVITSSFEDIKFLNKSHIKFLFKNRNQYPFQSDAKKITSIIQNVISNAVKYYDDQKTHPYVKADVHVGKTNCRIVISDNGIGIPMDKQQKVFDMFYRGTNKSSGTGLGLFILKEMVSKLKGNISLESEEGIGTKIVLDIPNMLHFTIPGKIA